MSHLFHLQGLLGDEDSLFRNRYSLRWRVGGGGGVAWGGASVVSCQDRKGTD